MVTVRGSCHCGNVVVELALTRAPETYQPRACDCDFCRKHAAAYLSDPKGSLRIRVEDAGLLGKYRQGSNTADCLLCTRCGVLIGVLYENAGQTFAAVNYRVVDAGTSFGSKTVVSPKLLDTDDRVARWRMVWFADVALVFGPLLRSP